MRKLFGTFLVTLALVSTVPGCAPVGPDTRESSGEKAEWSVLQKVEHAHRGQQLAEPMIVEVDGHQVLGVRALTGGNVWVLLKPESPPYYKQLPETNYTVPISLVSSLSVAGKLGYTVEAVLSSRTVSQ